MLDLASRESFLQVEAFLTLRHHVHIGRFRNPWETKNEHYLTSYFFDEVGLLVKAGLYGILNDLKFTPAFSNAEALRGHVGRKGLGLEGALAGLLCIVQHPNFRVHF